MKSRIILLIVINLIYFFPAFSQKTSLSIGAELALPQALELKNHAGTGIGGSLRFQTTFNKKISGIATIGYLSFAEKEFSNPYGTFTTKFTAIPVQLGVKYYPSTSKEVPSGFFISGELGLVKSQLIGYNDTREEISERNRIYLGFAPGIGYDAGVFETSLRLQFNIPETGFDIYYFNLRVAYAFLRK